MRVERERKRREKRGGKGQKNPGGTVGDAEQTCSESHQKWYDQFLFPPSPSSTFFSSFCVDTLLVGHPVKQRVLYYTRHQKKEECASTRDNRALPPPPLLLFLLLLLLLLLLPPPFGVLSLWLSLYLLFCFFFFLPPFFWEEEGWGARFITSPRLRFPLSDH